MIPDNQTLTRFRKFSYEVMLIGLVGAVVTLFNLYLSLNSYVRETLTNEIVKTREVIQANNDALKSVNIFLIKNHEK